MIRRAKISVLFTLVGALTASGALLNPGQRHPAFQPGRTPGLTKPVVMKPAQALVANRLWQGASVQRITASSPATVQVGPGGMTLARAGDATVTPGAVRKAGGGW
ncbi:MAG TPA: hypothetical protein VGD97_04025 [Lacunisphaera sp.]